MNRTIEGAKKGLKDNYYGHLDAAFRNDLLRGARSDQAARTILSLLTENRHRLTTSLAQEKFDNSISLLTQFLENKIDQTLFATENDKNMIYYENCISSGEYLEGYSGLSVVKNR